CVRVLDQIEDNPEMTNLDFVELNACTGGCVGGSMTVTNPYIAQARLQTLKRYLPVSPNRPASEWIPDKFFNEDVIEYSPYNLLSDDRKEARRMMSDIQSITESLPKLDCGSCGAPTCMAFAEDIVKGETTADECTVIMRMLFHEYLEQHKDKSLLDKLKEIKQSDETQENK
ncbi:MAG: ferredoxin, partial [Ruminococcaceae bacterium]|nr:ferredoxin [Oscillospiraceae bacterium]